MIYGAGIGTMAGAFHPKQQVVNKAVYQSPLSLRTRKSGILYDMITLIKERRMNL